MDALFRKSTHHRSSSRAHHGFSQKSTWMKLDCTRYTPRDSRRLLLINHEGLGGLDRPGSYGFPIGPTTWRFPRPAQGLLEDTEQGGVISEYSRTDLDEHLGKVDSVIELGLSKCKWLGLEQLPYPLTYIKRGRQYPLYLNSIIQSNTKTSRRTEPKLV